MALVHRFTLPWAVAAGHDVFIQGLGLFTAGVFDVDPSKTSLITALQAASGVTDAGTVDNATSPPPSNTGSNDPFPQYLLPSELDAAIADSVANGAVTPVILRAAYVPKWKPSTAYASGEFVLNPSGQIVSANSAFTSGATYSAGNWTVVSGGGGGSTTDASLLTSGILPAARIADGSIADSKLAAGTALSAAERTKLAAVASGATANATDAQLRDRSTHTGTQAASTVTGLATVATTGAYTDLSAKPTVPTTLAALTGDTNVTSPTAGQVLTYSSSAGKWQNSSGIKLNLAASTYNISPTSLRFARAAAARAASGGNTFHIAIAGDSTTVGSPGPATFGGLWAEVLLADLLAHGAASRGTGMLALDVATKTGGPATTTGLSSYAGGIARTGSFLSGGSGNTLTVTANTDQFRVMYQKRTTTGGTITATVDGSAVTSIDCSSTGGTGVFFQTYNVTQGSHTLVLTAPASSNGFILGVEARANGSTGSSKVSVFARGGKSSASLADNSTESSGSSIQAITALVADLLIIDIGINDYLGASDAGGSQVALATYKANLQAAITAQRAVNGDVLLVGWPPNSNTTNTIPQSGYIQQLYDLCDANDVALIDFQLRWGSYAISNAAPISYYADGTHPNAAGHADMGNAMYAALALLGVGV